MLKEELKAKYAQERDKRIRQDGPAQYVNFLQPEFAHLNKDPWVDYDAIAADPNPLIEGDDMKFLVIGGGHAAMCFAYRMFESGMAGSDICIVDAAGGVGGTWYYNRYPGLMCDVEGYVYLPMLEETGYMPKHKYSYGKEIRQQSERIVEKGGFRTSFATRVTKLQFDEKTTRWIATMTQDLGPKHGTRNFTVRSHFIYVSDGPFYAPRIPSAPGFDVFAQNNKVFHTARWQYDISGGSEDKQDLTKFKDKVVAVVGTGATAVQVIPEVAKWAKHVYVVQRTPCYVGPRNQTKTDPTNWRKITAEKGWQEARRDNLDHFIANDPLPNDIVADGWSKARSFAGVSGSPGIVTPETREQFIESLIDVDNVRTEELRAYVDEVVHDKATAEKLKGWYYGWCKRPSFHDDYLDTFNKPNVTLIDTNGQGLQNYTKSGFIADGIEYQCDVLVLATGFSVTSSNPKGVEGSAQVTIVGRKGETFGDKWMSERAGTVFGIMSEGFPNLFFGGSGRGAGTGPNLTSAYDVSARLAAHLVKTGMAKTANSSNLLIEPSKEGEEAYSQEVLNRALSFCAFGNCTPGYFTRDWTPILKQENSLRGGKLAPWGEGLSRFRHMTQKYREEGSVDGLNITG